MKGVFASITTLDFPRLDHHPVRPRPVAENAPAAFAIAADVSAASLGTPAAASQPMPAADAVAVASGLAGC